MQDTAEVRAAVDDLFDAILAHDIERIQGHYLQDDRLFIFLEGWHGKIEGFDKGRNAESWNGLLNQVEFFSIELDDDVKAGRDGDLGWVGGTVHAKMREPDADAPAEISNRGTWIMEKHDGVWLIVFEHVSFPKDKPYGAESIRD